MKKSSLSVFLIICFFLLGSFNFVVAEEKKGQAPLFATIPPIVYLLKRLLGDDYPVKLLLDNGQNYHHLEVAPKTAINLSQSLAYFTVGLPLEDALFSKGASKMTRFKIDRGIKKIENDHGHKHNHKHSHDAHQHDGHDDSHLWLSFDNLVLLTQNSATDLISLFPDKKKKIMENHDQLIKEIGELKRFSIQKLSECKTRTFFTTHASLGQFCLEVNFNEKSLQEEGKSFSPSRLKKFYDEIRKDRAKLFLYRKGLDDAIKDKISKDLALTFYHFDPIEEDVISNLKELVNSLSSSCHATEVAK